MNFIDTKKIEKFEVMSASKSKIASFKKCALKAYKDARNTKAFSGSSSQMSVGNIAHEFADRKVKEMMGLDVAPYDYASSSYDLETYFEFYSKIERNLRKIDGILSGHTIISTEESFTIELDDVCTGFRFIAKPDVLSYTEYTGVNYIHVTDWKTGFSSINNVDEEALLYAYAAFKKYNMPVVFSRLNLMTGASYTHTFHETILMQLEPQIIKILKDYKKAMESNISPEFQPGSHCSYCPYIEQCDGRKYAHSLQQKFKIAIWAKALASKMESEVKASAGELLAQSPEETIPVSFLNGRYGVEAQVSESIQLAGRKVSKKDIFEMLIEDESLELIKDTIDFKISPELKDALENLHSVKTKVVTRTVIKLKPKEDEDEEDQGGSDE
jgi:CRISPR/Cas system-associated exonuclease Cas4 (RecB family)